MVTVDAQEHEAKQSLAKALAGSRAPAESSLVVIRNRYNQVEPLLKGLAGSLQS